MNLAKATKEDCQKIWDLYHLAVELSEEFEDTPVGWKLGRATDVAHQGVMGRVVFGMETLIDNAIFDPAKTHLAIHPRFAKSDEPDVEPTELW